MRAARLKLLYVADGRSPITVNWIKYFIESGHEVHLASTYPCRPELNLESLEVVPVAFNQAAGGSEREKKDPSGKFGQATNKVIRQLTTPGARTRLRQWLGALTIPKAARQLRQYIDHVQPDLVHAMRIPYEGMLATASEPACPLIVSVWGNDFTLHAASNPWMAALTRRVLQRANGLHTDCERDMRLAHRWGFAASRPAAVLPSAGGVQLDIFYPADRTARNNQEIKWENESATVINPRGMRAYVRNDVFFQAIPRVLERLPEVRFICPAMEDEPEARRWLDALQISSAVRLLPRQSRVQMAELFRLAQIAISPSQHDGTPNTLLESMACGCFPIAGDIESLREWIIPEVNGLLFEPGDPCALADSVLRAFEQPELLANAARHNADLIAERAEYGLVMRKAAYFYLAASQS